MSPLAQVTTLELNSSLTVKTLSLFIAMTNYLPTTALLTGIVSMITFAIDWSGVYSAHDCADKRWSAFSSTLNDAILQLAPTSIKHVRISAAQSNPYPIRKLITKKASLWKRRKLSTPKNSIKHIGSLCEKQFTPTLVKWRVISILLTT